MRILVVHNYYQDPGGEDLVFRQEVEALKETHTVDTLTFKNQKGIKGLLQYLFYPYNVWAAYQLKQKIKRFHPDIIHIHNTHYASGPILFRVAQRQKIPTVFTLHNYRLICPSATLLYNGHVYMNSIGKSFPWDGIKKGILDNSILKTFLTAFTYKLHSFLGTWTNVGSYLTLTHCAKKLIIKSTLHIASERIVVKPNFITQPEIPDEVITDNYYLYIGRLSEEKGVKPLMTAFTQNHQHYLKIIGDGPLKDFVVKNLSPNIEYLGFQNKETINACISKSKGVIIPSVCLEGFPLTLLEAMALKTPVFLSQILAANEVIDNHKNGIVFMPDELAETLNNTKTLDLKKIGIEGYKTYKENFTKSEIMSRLENVYKNLLK